jgi:hypothetical protein
MTQRAPEPPHDTVAVGDYTGITLRWSQRGAVDAWTVYCDPMDGSETATSLVTSPTHRFADLAPGLHHLGVVAWHNGKPNRGEGSWVDAEVLVPDADTPCIPVITAVDSTDGQAAVSWISQDAATWQAQLLTADGALLAQREAQHRWSTFTELRPSTRYGLQVRALDDQRRPSPWSEVEWVQTEPAAAPLTGT